MIGTANVLTRIEALAMPSRLEVGLEIHGLHLDGDRPLPVVRCATKSDAGYGEAPPLPTFTGETGDDTLRRVRATAPELLGRSADEALDALHGAAAPGSPPARAALDAALHDLIARQRGVPLHALLGGAKTRRVPVSRAIGWHDSDRTVELARGYAARGVRALKLKVGREPALDAAVIRAVRRELGNGVELAIDANGAYSVPDALELAQRTRDLALAYFEQPVERHDLAGMRAVRDGGVKVLADESLFDLNDARRLVDAEAADLFAIKLIKCGGLRPALDIARFAHERDIPVVVIDPLGSAVSLLAGLHLAATLEPHGYAHGLSGSLEVHAPHAPPPPLRDGALEVPDVPGLGTEVCWPSSTPTPHPLPSPDDPSERSTRKEFAMNLAFATIGEAPRDDVVPYLRRQLPADTVITEDGVLNHLEHDEILALDTGDDSLHMVTRARDGSAYRLNYERTLPHMQRVVDGLVDRGADLVVILCGADWSSVHANVPVVNPGKLFPNLVQALGSGLKLGVIKPDAGQIPFTERHYRELGLDPVVTAASPYRDDRLELARQAAEELAARDVDMVWMTCIGMDETVRAAVREVLPRPSILARSILAKVIAELLADPTPGRVAVGLAEGAKA